MNAIQIIVALYGYLALPVLLLWAFAVSSRQTYRDFKHWRQSVRKRQRTGAGIGAAG